jgi:hypothetical protein
MRTLTRIGLAFSLVFALSATAFAQDPRPGAADLAPDVSYDFDDDFVEGGVDSPMGDLLVGRLRGHRTTLIRPRVHFVPELMKSVERL